MISDYPIVKKIAWTSGTRRAGASMETHREYVGYLDEWDGAERLTDEEIVRCMDCVICHRDEVGMWCCLCGTGFYRRPTGESDFCSKGKRRDA